ncbi:hypothetical protein VFPBJ_07375 [Purpureocillium lilacinum]|nr:hypothetical protein VFPBJ_07375 [Purpureocillium lilacinum]
MVRPSLSLLLVLACTRPSLPSAHSQSARRAAPPPYLPYLGSPGCPPTYLSASPARALQPSGPVARQAVPVLGCPPSRRAAALSDSTRAGGGPSLPGAASTSSRPPRPLCCWAQHLLSRPGPAPAHSSPAWSPVFPPRPPSTHPNAHTPPPTRDATRLSLIVLSIHHHPSRRVTAPSSFHPCALQWDVGLLTAAC